MIVDCAHYRDGKRQNEAPLALEEAADYCVGGGEFVWLGLKDLNQNGRRFHLRLRLRIERNQDLELRR